MNFLPLQILLYVRGEGMNEIRLVKKAKKGDKEALVQLVMAEKDAYYRLAFTYLGNEHDAMDAMEEMIVILYEKVDQLKKDVSFYSWSKTILVNHCKQVLRRQKKIVLLEDFNAVYMKDSDHVSRDNPYITIEQKVDIQKSLLRLSVDQREAIELKYFHDLDNQSIADITCVPIGTVKSRVFKGLNKLREYYGGNIYGSN
jgi:RNA polymerase sigma-70 factor (ECF subfamily)